MSDYSHRFHVGNIGDVWKHCVLIAWLDELRASGKDLLVIDTHAGEGRYELGPTGEWTEGVGKLWRSTATWPAAVQRYLEVVGTGPKRYPGSPEIVRQLLGAHDRASFFDMDERAHAALKRALGEDDPRIRVVHGDGLAGMLTMLSEQPAAEVLVLIDPPWAEKEDWQQVPDVVSKAHALAPHARICLWYPLKSYTRPNAMLQRLGKLVAPAVTLELITTPLDLQRNRLNGSGVFLVNPSAALVAAASLSGPALGAACATHGGRYSLRTIAWSEPWEGKAL